MAALQEIDAAWLGAVANVMRRVKVAAVAEVLKARVRAVGDRQVMAVGVRVQAVRGAEQTCSLRVIGLAGKDALPLLRAEVGGRDVVGPVAVRHVQRAGGVRRVGGVERRFRIAVFVEFGSRKDEVEVAVEPKHYDLGVAVGGHDQPPLAVELHELGAVKVDRLQVRRQLDDFLALQIGGDRHQAAARHAVVDAAARFGIDGEAAVQVHFARPRRLRQGVQVVAQRKHERRLATGPGHGSFLLVFRVSANSTANGRGARPARVRVTLLGVWSGV